MWSKSGQKVRCPPLEDEVVEHEETEWVVQQFIRFGTGILSESTGRPSPEGFAAACGPMMMNIRMPENALFMLDMFQRCASGRIEAQQDDREDRERKRKR